MAQYTLTVVDTTGIQNYIFGSNNLRHNVGASGLVHRATHDWVFDALAKTGITNVNMDGEFDDRTIESDRLTAELVYAGGGNTVVLFRTHDVAVDFTRSLTRRALLEAPGLQLVIAHTDFDWERSPSLAKVVGDTIKKVGQKKGDHAQSAPLLGLGVTANCQFTGMPAVGVDQEHRRISSEVQAKMRVADEAHKRLVKELPLIGYDIPKDFDDFGRTEGESSYIAVVHTDGNGMGRRVRAIADAYPRPEDNRSYIQAIRSFSDSVRNVAREALNATYQQLIQCVDSEDKIGGVILVRDGKIPLRPIVLGGDDVTFVCDGRLGLTLTEFYLRRVTARPLEDGRPLSARAGIAVVKTHYPFARAYALAEKLAESAKKYIKERQKPPYEESYLTAMDWHFAVSGLVLDLEEIRRREYTVPTGRLTMRPLRLTPENDADWHSWQVFNRIVEGFLREGWPEKRNKVKALRDVLRKGPAAVEQFLHLYQSQLPDEVPNIPNLARTGWAGKECGYFDAIEALDFFVPLERST